MPNSSNASLSAQPNCKPPIANWKRFPIPFPTICARPSVPSRVIQAETQRMGRLVDGLLNFSRLGRQPMKSSAVDMTALAQEVSQELVARSCERAPRLELEPLPPARGDRPLIRQVLATLLSNAIK